MALDILGTIGGVKGLLDIVKLARELRTNASMSAADSNEVVVNIWGSILHELRKGCERARLFVEYADKKNFLSYATFSFEICDAVFPEFCRIVPSPALLMPTAGLLAELRQIDHFQRSSIGKSHRGAKTAPAGRSRRRSPPIACRRRREAVECAPPATPFARAERPPLSRAHQPGSA
jgi:hypothetical protein